MVRGGAVAQMITEALVLALALSMDAFFASFSYGSNRIRIPLCSVLIVNAVSATLLGASLLVGSLVRQYMPGWLTPMLCFGILFVLGLVKLLDSMTKTFIRKHQSFRGNVKFSFFNFRFVLTLYADPESADVDHSKIISPMEAATLAVALSLDGMAVGFGAAMGEVNGWALVAMALMTDALAVILGSRFGNRVAQKLPFNISWLSGLLLIVMAFTKL